MEIYLSRKLPNTTITNSTCISFPTSPTFHPRTALFFSPSIPLAPSLHFYLNPKHRHWSHREKCYSVRKRYNRHPMRWHIIRIAVWRTIEPRCPRPQKRKKTAEKREKEKETRKRSRLWTREAEREERRVDAASAMEEGTRSRWNEETARRRKRREVSDVTSGERLVHVRRIASGTRHASRMLRSWG